MPARATSNERDFSSSRKRIVVEAGLIEMDSTGKVISLEEKPDRPKSYYAQTGFYLYDEKACSLTKSLRPSERGELEIVDLNNIYLANGELHAEVLKGEWIDAGTFDSLSHANRMVDHEK